MGHRKAMSPLRMALLPMSLFHFLSPCLTSAAFLRRSVQGSPNNTCALPDWLSDMADSGIGSVRSLSLIESEGTSGDLMIFNGGDDDDGPLVLFDCSKKKTLVFLHIPKNAGTSIEAIGRRGGNKWGKVVITSKGFTKRLAMPDGNTCSSWHVPPYLYPGNMYKQSEVFCVVRDPKDRVVSEFRWQADLGRDRGCDPSKMNRWIQNQVKKVHTQRFHSDCHFVPQTDYVVNPRSGQPTCKHVLKMNTLSGDFNNLMKRNGYKLKMSLHKNSGDKCPGLTSGSLYPNTISMIHSTYFADYALLNSPPTTTTSTTTKMKTKTTTTSTTTMTSTTTKAPTTTKVLTRAVHLGAQPELCLNVFLHGARAQVGDELGIWACTGVFNEEVVLQSDGTVRLELQPELCLSIMQPGTPEQVVDGQALSLQPCTGAWNQRFESMKDGTVRPASKLDMCASVVLKGAKSQSGDKVALYHCQGPQGSWNQRFYASSR